MPKPNPKRFLPIIRRAVQNLQRTLDDYKINVARSKKARGVQGIEGATVYFNGEHNFLLSFLLTGTEVAITLTSLVTINTVDVDRASHLSGEMGILVEISRQAAREFLAEYFRVPGFAG